MPSVTCKRCGLEWVPIVPQPKTCPRCKTYYWRTERKAKSA